MQLVLDQAFTSVGCVKEYIGGCGRLIFYDQRLTVYLLALNRVLLFSSIRTTFRWLGLAKVLCRVISWLTYGPVHPRTVEPFTWCDVSTDVLRRFAGVFRTLVDANVISVP